jgi:hypothetical protein
MTTELEAARGREVAVLEDTEYMAAYQALKHQI